MEPASNEMTHSWGLIDEREGKGKDSSVLFPMKAQQQRE